MMTSFSIGELAGEVSNKRPLENSFVPRCKTRKISAVRDFPLGCCLDAAVTDFKPEEADASEAGISESSNPTDDEMDDVPVNDVVKPLITSRVLEGSDVVNFEMVNCLEPESVGNADLPKILKLDDSRNGETVAYEEPSGFHNSHEEVDCRRHDFNSPVDVEVAESMDVLAENITTMTADALTKVEELAGKMISTGVDCPNEVDCQNLEVLNQLPVSCRHEVLDSLVKEETKAIDGFPNCVDAPPMEFDPSVEKTESDGRKIWKELNEEKALALIPNSDTKGAKSALDTGMPVDALPLSGSSQSSSLYHDSSKVAMLKDKCSFRRLSAVRDFPPHCGTLNLPAEEKQQMITKRTDSQDGIENVKAEQEASNVLDSGLSGATLMGISGTIAVQENHDEEVKARQVEFGIGTVIKETLDNWHETKSTIVHSLAAEPYLTPVPIRAVSGTAGQAGKEVILYSQDGSDKMRTLQSGLIMEDEMEREVVHGLVAATYCPWGKGKVIEKNSHEGISGRKVQKQNFLVRKKAKVVAKGSSSKMNVLGEQSSKKKKVHVDDEADRSTATLMLTDKEDLDRHGELTIKTTTKLNKQNIDASLLPFGPNNSSQGDARSRVRETLRMFHTICRKILQKEEANSTPDEEGNTRESDKKTKRIDLLSAKIIKEKGKEVNTDKHIIGQVPGVEVGDEFQYRVELAIVGIHRLYQAGIDYLKVNGKPIATSIVASGAYSDDLENADVLIYSGQGGNIVGKVKKPEDQKLERGNLALWNSISAGTPVRVVRGWKEMKAIDPTDSRAKTVTIYVYDGLYTVNNYWTETGPHGKLVFMFELRRNAGQPELAWKELKSSNKPKIRPGICVNDVSGGKEFSPICAINTIDDEKPPPFNYTRRMIYPDWHCPVPPEGCNCTVRCGDTKKCPCAVRNGGEIPYNRNGAIVEAKPLVFECGPSCKCPPSCYNRVTQRGIKFKLEIFKTDLRGWGIRPLNSIPSGSFICEYAGELLEEKEAEQRIGNDEYLFDIGENYSDFSLKPEEQEIESVEEAEVGYTIDAGQYGNVGRFVNHSCSPNLYAQNVIYDHHDKRMPHVMLFAAENIPPLQELTYHYNYKVDQIHDSDGNIKIKECHCGSAECTGRMY